METDHKEILYAKLNGETARIAWYELQRHFARGVVIKVEAGVDLVEVATQFALDDKAAILNYMDSGQIARASDADALGWSAGDTVFWAVVAAPWVLVQETAETNRSLN